MADCGGYGNTEQNVHLSFKSSFAQGNGLPIASSASSFNCYLSDDVYNRTNGQLVSYDFCEKGGNIPGVPFIDMCQVQTTVNMNVHKGSGSTSVGSVQLYPFFANVECDLKAFYRQVGGENHLIVQVSNVSSYLILSKQGIGGPTIYGTSCYNAYRGFAFTMAVSFSANISDSAWKYCLGGWRTEPCHQCTSGNCSANSVGGYFYYWNSTQRDNPFGVNRMTGRFNAGPYEWDMGAISIPEGAVMYIALAPTVGQANCESQQRDRDTVVMLGINPPALNVCPPEITGERHERDICENCAIAKFDIAANDLIGQSSGSLVVEYLWNKTLATADWSNVEVSNFDIYQNQPMTITLPCLVPSSHYAYRMKIVLNGGVFSESDYVYGEFDTLFIPPPNMTVPDITEPECVDIDSGNLIPPFEEIVCYGGCENGNI